MKARTQSVGRLAVGAILFGALMTVRHELPGLWLRAGCAGVAAALLTVAVLGFRSE